MKANLLRILSLALCMAMLLGMAPMVQLIPTASAAAPSAKGDCGADHSAHTPLGTPGATDPVAVPASDLASGGNFKLVSDIVISGTVNVNADINLHVDLNGFSITTATKTANFFKLTGQRPTEENGQVTLYATLTICDCVGTGRLDATGNSAPVINLNQKTVLNLNGGTISGVSSSATGGGVYQNAWDSTVVMNGGAISKNTATYGGGVYVKAGTFTLAGGVISDNKATTTGGGIQYSSTNKTHNSFTMIGGTISGNTAPKGGGVYFDNASGASAAKQIAINGGEITGNSATTDGGAVWLGTYNSMTITGGVFTANQAKNGGVFYVNGTGGSANRPTLRIEGGTFAKNLGKTPNTADNEGWSNGSILLTNGCLLTITGGNFVENVCSADTFTISGSQVEISGGKISGNLRSNGNPAYVHINNYLYPTTADLTGNVVIEDLVISHNNRAATYQDDGVTIKTPASARPTINIKNLTCNATVLVATSYVEYLTSVDATATVVSNGSVYTNANGQIDVKHNLTLDSEIDFSFFVKKADLASVDGLTATVTHYVADGVAKTRNATWEEYMAEDGTEYWRVRYTGVAAKQMADTLTLTVKNGDQVVLVDICSVKEYAENRIAKNADDVNLMNKLLEYGYAAQEFFGYNTGYHACDTAPTASVSGDEGNPGTVKHNLSLNSQIDFSFYVLKTALASAEGNVATITHNGVPVQAVQEADAENPDYWRFRYVGVAAKQMTDELSFEIQGKEGKITDAWSVQDYALRRIAVNDNETTAAVEDLLMSALLEYGTAAQQFFGYNTSDLANGSNA